MILRLCNGPTHPRPRFMDPPWKNKNVLQFEGGSHGFCPDCLAEWYRNLETRREEIALWREMLDEEREVTHGKE